MAEHFEDIVEDLKSKKRYKKYLFTDYNLRDGDITAGYPGVCYKYMVWGIEKCPTTGKPHRQGCVWLVNGKTIAALKKRMGAKFKGKVFPITSFWNEVRAYCMKDDEYHELGELGPGQGARTDLTKVKDDLKNGKRVQDIMMEEPELYCQYRNGINDIAKVAAMRNMKKFKATEVIALVGPPGVGKTRFAYDKYWPDLYRWDHTDKWFDGYMGQQTILLDDFYGGVKWTRMLQLLDVYPILLQVKGGHVVREWTRVVITSNTPPNEWYPSDIGALLGRIALLVDFYQKKVFRFDRAGNCTEVVPIIEGDHIGALI